jgi:ABC-type multidrug transport system ATPase subunit
MLDQTERDGIRPMHEPHPIRADSLTHRYAQRIALQEVSFDVPAGAIFGLLGPNGGGKTTLFRILCTWMKPSSGVAYVAGRSVLIGSGRGSPSHRRRLPDNQSRRQAYRR